MAAAGTAGSGLVYKRLLLKLSGEALMGKAQFGIDMAVAERLSRDIAETKSVLDQRPNVAKRMRRYMEEARKDLGDSLTGVEPTNAREIGKQEVKK